MSDQWTFRLLATFVIFTLLLGGCGKQQSAPVSGPTPTPGKLERLAKAFGVDSASSQKAYAAAATVTAVAGSTPARTPAPVAWDVARQAAERSAAELGLIGFQADETAAIVTAVNPKDGAQYVYVPAGEFFLGSPLTDANAGAGEHPLQLVNVDEFWIMQTEVTKKQIGYGASGDAAYHAGHKPIETTWAEANRYAHWAGGRLPTEAEWEKACRGTDGRRFPWGDEAPTAETANFADDVGHSLPVKTYAADVSPYGAYDMAGNASEWTNSAYWPYPYRSDDGREGPSAPTRALRGGDYFSTATGLRCAGRRLGEVTAGALTELYDAMEKNGLVAYTRGGFRVVLVPSVAVDTARP